MRHPQSLAIVLPVLAEISLIRGPQNIDLQVQEARDAIGSTTLWIE